jgi:hypothetical protein
VTQQFAVTCPCKASAQVSQQQWSQWPRVGAVALCLLVSVGLVACAHGRRHRVLPPGPPTWISLESEMVGERHQTWSVLEGPSQAEVIIGVELDNTHQDV